MKKNFKNLGLALLLTVPAWATNPPPVTLPSLPPQSTTPGVTFALGTSKLNITQITPTAVINWNSYNIGAGGIVNYYYSTAGAPFAVLNRVIGGGSTDIEGTLNATNGQVYLINQNGILIGKTGAVNAGGFVASTRDIAQDFDFNTLHFLGYSSQGVTNLGKITASLGSIVLIGKTVDNEGTLTANKGTAGLIAADEVLLGQTNADGSSILVNIPSANNNTVAGTAVKNGGTISAVTAELKVANGNLYALAIDNGGTIQANFLQKQGGRIYLSTDAGTVNTGKLTSIQGSSGLGGSINISGDTINVNNTISGTNATLTLNAQNTITPTDTGKINVGSFILQTGNWVQEVGLNGVTTLAGFTATNDFELQNNSTFLRVLGGDGSANPFQITDVYGLQGVGTYLNSNFILANNISALGTAKWNNGRGFNPIGGGGNASYIYQGTFDGQGFTITNLTINDPVRYVGLFGYMGQGATIQNVKLTYANVSGGAYVGTLVGENFFGSIYNCSVGGSSATDVDKVHGGNLAQDIGGLVGQNSGTIMNCTAAVNISGGDSALDLGGLVGQNLGTISYQSGFGSGLINGTGATGTVIAGYKAQGLGGLVGENDGNIQASYSRGAVTAGDSAVYVGGFVGLNASQDRTDINGNAVFTIANCFSTGSVSVGKNASDVGGLVGLNAAPTGNNASTSVFTSTIQNVYSRGNVTVKTYSSGLGGLVGENDSILQYAYTTGIITKGSFSTAVGGLAGVNNGLITSTYWLQSTSTNTNLGLSGVGLDNANGNVAGNTGATPTGLNPLYTSITATYTSGPNQGNLINPLANDPNFDFGSTWTQSLSPLNNGGVPYLQATGTF